METESPNSPEMEQESPDSPDEGGVLFIEDRTPASISNPLTTNSLPEKTLPNGSIDSEEFITLDTFVDSGAKELQKTQEDAPVENGEIESSDSEDESPPADDLCLVVEDRNPQLTGQEIQIPRYTINENILNAVHNPQGSKQKRKKLGNPCFNCGETTHPLRECPNPRNHAEINRNRREFLDSRTSERPVYKRYHVDESQQYSHLVPGELSAELRQALGLEERELPSYIYRMRCLGYPPGWLEEALVPQSGITMMIDGKDGKQNGQTDNHSKEKYDARKLVRYPGFNVLPPPGTHDDCHYYCSPPMSRNQSLDVMLERLGSQVGGGYKRKKLSFNTQLNGDNPHSTESEDMEYEEVAEGQELPEDNCKFVPPLPDAEDVPPPPPMDTPVKPAKESEENADESTTSSLSLDSTLEDLEAQKQALLSQLNDTTPNCSTPNSRIGKTKCVDLGTPILKSVSPYARLPSAEKFSVNICDVINFENLPDSTGKYEQMSGLLKKVRTQLTQLNQE